MLLRGTKALVFGVADEIDPARQCRVLATIEATVLPLHMRRMCNMVSAAVLSWLRQQTVLPAWTRHDDSRLAGSESGPRWPTAGTWHPQSISPGAGVMGGEGSCPDSHLT